MITKLLISLINVKGIINNEPWNLHWHKFTFDLLSIFNDIQ